MENVLLDQEQVLNTNLRCIICNKQYKNELAYLKHHIICYKRMYNDKDFHSICHNLIEQLKDTNLLLDAKKIELNNLTDAHKTLISKYKEQQTKILAWELFYLENKIKLEQYSFEIPNVIFN